MQRLIELPVVTPPVGVVGDSRTCMENLLRSMEGAGLDHLNFIEVYVDQADKETALFGKVQAVVCSSFTARKLRELGAPEDLEITE